MKKILAIDPSFRNTGYAVIGLGGSAAADKVLESGIIRTEKNDKKRGLRAADQTVEQIGLMVSGLRVVAGRCSPSMMVVELPTSGGKSSRAVASMAIAQAVCAAFAVYEGLPAEWVTPRDVKKAAGGSYAAGKEEVQAHVLGLHPGLRAVYEHKSGAHKGSIRCEFEHVADAIGAFEAVKGTSPLVRMLRT